MNTSNINSDLIDPYYDLNIQVAVHDILQNLDAQDLNRDMPALLGYIRRLEERLDDLCEMNESLTYNERKLYEQKMNIIQHAHIRGADLLHSNIDQTKQLLFTISNITRNQYI